MRLIRTLSAVVAMAAILASAGTVRAQVKKTEILKAVDDAFKAWEAVSCSKLKFKYAGEVTPFVSEKEGAILVYFAHDKATWIHNSQNAYYGDNHYNLETEGDLTKGIIGLNAKDYSWSLGKEKNKIDIQTAILHMIPNAVGFYVGHDMQTGSLKAFVTYDSVNHKLDPLHEKAARYTYFEAGTGCTRPAKPQICGLSPVKPDAGVMDATAVDATAVDATAVDAGYNIQLCIQHSSISDLPKGKPLHWKTMPIPYYVYLPDSGKLPGSSNTGNDGGADDAGDDSGTGGDGDDSGCCRVSHTRSENLAGTSLLLLALGALFWRRRRR